MLARPSALLRSSSRPSPELRLLRLDPSRPHQSQRTPAFRFDFVCGFRLPSELMPPPALEVSLDLQPPSTCRQASWLLLRRTQAPTCDASRAALVVPHHHSRLRLATPPGMLQPDLGSEVHSVSVVPTGSTVARVHPALRLPDIRATEVTGTRWDTDGTPRCVPHPSKTCSSSTAAPPHDVACLLAVHRSDTGSPTLPATSAAERKDNRLHRIRVPTSPPGNERSTVAIRR